MNQREKELFQSLFYARNWQALRVKNSLPAGIERGSESAHFILEFLKNADEAQATEARFELMTSSLFFAHNGSRQFSISDVQTEEDLLDQNKNIGDINAMTLPDHFIKERANLGQFGFKSVFSYTKTLYLADDNWSFKIEDFIVPYLLSEEVQKRKRQPKETSFFFYFDSSTKNFFQDYKEVSQKLSNLIYPLLFANHLQKITFVDKNMSGYYQKEVQKRYFFDEVRAELVCLKQSIKGHIKKEKFWLFTQTIKKKGKRNSYSIAFRLDDLGQIQPLKNQSAFHFFALQDLTGLNFLIQGPFLLNSTREKLGMYGNQKSQNEEVIYKLARLASQAFLLLIEIEKEESVILIKNSLTELIPYDCSELDSYTGEMKTLFRPFYSEIQKTLKKANIIPTSNGYASAQNAYWAATPELPKLFSEEQLQEIFENSSAHWAFPALGFRETQNKNSALYIYLKSMVDPISELDILQGRKSQYSEERTNFKIHKRSKGISGSFIENQTIPWLHQFYGWLSLNPSLWESIRYKSIFLNQNKKAVAAFHIEDGNPILFFSDQRQKGRNIIYPELLKNNKTRQFFEAFGIGKKQSGKMREQALKAPTSSFMNAQSFTTPKENGTSFFSPQEMSSLSPNKERNELEVKKYNIPLQFSSKMDNSYEKEQKRKEAKALDEPRQKIQDPISKSRSEILPSKPLQELKDESKDFPKYSYGWFRSLLKMEVEKKESSRSSSTWIAFSQVEREPHTKRTLVLKVPDYKLSSSLEDLSDMVIRLCIGKEEKKVSIEVANVQEDRLRVKLKNPEEINGIDLEAVHKIKLEKKSPSFLIKSLEQEFSMLGYPNDFDMQQGLPKNISFIFGPPGTGKTTYLAQEFLRPLMKKKEKCKVLVLAPTNKAADVLTRKIMEMAPKNDEEDYKRWLIRFGSTGDEIVEKSEVLKDKTFGVSLWSKFITVTTIARFPYDGFRINGEALYLRDMDWDFIVFDEASMISLPAIVYALYKKSPEKFIVAGDPFQIGPIVEVNKWKDENIYTLVNLNSFKAFKTVPHAYDVIPLMHQYRSIPEIGNIFSQFTYDGKLTHYRNSRNRKELNLKNGLSIRPLNIFKFPVNSYGSIYEPKQLNTDKTFKKKWTFGTFSGSHYHIYSALFVYEYVVYLAKALAQANPEGQFKIGIIGPYRIQMDIIDKLFSLEKLPRQVSVQIGTVHGFQGDECDIIFTILNPPALISKTKNLENVFVSNRNILNVSISRARDYLFVLMPDDNTENIEHLELIKFIEELIKRDKNSQEVLTPNLELEIFGDSKYLENNTFFTTHQNVNVYSVPERRYEVRAESRAIDIQVHRTSPRAIRIHRPIGKPSLVSFREDKSLESLDSKNLAQLKEIVADQKTEGIKDTQEVRVIEEQKAVKEIKEEDLEKLESKEKEKATQEILTAEAIEQIIRETLEELEAEEKEKVTQEITIENLGQDTQGPLEELEAEIRIVQEEDGNDEEATQELEGMEKIHEEDFPLENPLFHKTILLQEALEELEPSKKAYLVQESSSKEIKEENLSSQDSAVAIKDSPLTEEGIVVEELTSKKEEIPSLSIDSVLLPFIEKPIEPLEEVTISEEPTVISLPKLEFFIEENKEALSFNDFQDEKSEVVQKEPLKSSSLQVILAKGKRERRFKLVEYIENPKEKTKKKLERMIMIFSSQEEKWIPVFVDEKDSFIYISQKDLREYQDTFKGTPFIELRKRGLWTTLLGKFKKQL